MSQKKPFISIITPVLDHPEFIEGYKRAVQGASEVILVDTGSTSENREAWASVGRVIDYPHQGRNYGHWCNAGYAVASGDIIVFLNNDVAPTGDWLAQVAGIEDGAIYGPELQAQIIDAVTVPFLSGWCIAARRETWERIREETKYRAKSDEPYHDPGYSAVWLDGPWDEYTYPAAGYWEDNALCFEAMLLGIELRQTQWPIQHLAGGNGTSKARQSYYADVARNRATFARRVREAMHAAV
jgi:glycosyltransferase involved in cell wall biosynthesis